MNRAGFAFFLLLVMMIVTPVHAMMRHAQGKGYIKKPVYHLIGFVTAFIVFGCIWAGVGYFWNIPGSIRTFAILGFLSAAVFLIISIFIEWLTHSSILEGEADEDDYFDN